MPVSLTRRACYGSRANDGLIDIRMAVSRNGGRSAHYSTARDGRRPFVQLGVNHCPLKSSPDASPRGMAWCDAAKLEAPGVNRSNREAVTGSWDTSVMYMLNGQIDSDDGEHILLCAPRTNRIARILLC